MALILLPGVSLIGLQPQMVMATQVIVGCYNRFGHDCVVTCGTEGKHGGTSLHYAGQALDYRTRDLETKHQLALFALIRDRLTSDFDVVLETDPPHLHCEWQPKFRAPAMTAIA